MIVTSITVKSLEGRDDKRFMGMERKMQENDHGQYAADGTLSSFMGRWGMRCSIWLVEKM